MIFFFSKSHSRVYFLKWIGIWQQNQIRLLYLLSHELCPTRFEDNYNFTLLRFPFYLWDQNQFLNDIFKKTWNSHFKVIHSTVRPLRCSSYYAAEKLFVRTVVVVFLVEKFNSILETASKVYTLSSAEVSLLRLDFRSSNLKPRGNLVGF